MKSIYGILAYPAKHSLSPIMHNSAFKSLDLDAEYLVFEKSPDQLEEFIKEVRTTNIQGLSISLPHKETVMQYLDEISEDARKIGAVNTILKRGPKLYGYNTDWIGSNKAIIESLGTDNLKEQIVVVLGAGGAARAIAYGALKMGADVWIKNRTKSKADAIAVEFAELFETEIHSEDIENMDHGDILINTTSVWLNENYEKSVINPYCNSSYLSNYAAVMDIVYNPFITPLLDEAFHGGCNIITGEKMLLYQAKEQFKMWTNTEAPHDVMLQKLLRAISS